MPLSLRPLDVCGPVIPACVCPGAHRGCALCLGYSLAEGESYIQNSNKLLRRRAFSEPYNRNGIATLYILWVVRLQVQGQQTENYAAGKAHSEEMVAIGKGEKEPGLGPGMG